MPVVYWAVLRRARRALPATASVRGRRCSRRRSSTRPTCSCSRIGRSAFQSRAHFSPIAANAMRRSSSSGARARREKRGGGRARAHDRRGARVAAPRPSIDTLALHAVLDRLAGLDPGQRDRGAPFFLRPDIEETAAAAGLGGAPSTAIGHWRAPGSPASSRAPPREPAEH